MSDLKFIPLRVHSDYSVVDGLHQPKKIISAAAGLAYPAMALTDVMSLSGWLQFCSAAFQEGLKPIAGVDFGVHTATGVHGRVSILARNEIGYRALLRLLTQACTKDHHLSAIKEKSLLWEELTPYSENLFFLSGGEDGWITQLLRVQSQEDHGAILEKVLHHWKESLFLEIQRTNRPNQDAINHALLNLSRKYQTFIVASHPVYFLSPSHYAPHQVRLAIQKSVRVTDKLIPSLGYSDQNYLQAQDLMCRLFSDLPEALKNSEEIAKRCTIFPKKYDPALPKIDTGSLSNDLYLKQLAQSGLEKRLEKNARAESSLEQYQNRLAHELEVIQSMGFTSYFLVVQEFIQWSKSQCIAVGPGRGSGAGSLVAYCLGITEIDPLQFQLLFERFLNSARVSLPDFDIDFCPKQRDRVIKHVIERYGQDSVAQIATFGTMMARGVIRDVGRALGHPYGFVDKIAKLVPFEAGMTLEGALSASPPLKTLYNEDEEVSALFDVARVLEGVIRNVGKHAGGIVIAPEPLYTYTPLALDAEEKYFLTQFDKDDLETIGLVKFDFLGLKTLTIIQEAIKSIHQAQQQAGLPLLQLQYLPLQDIKTFELLRSGQTAAIFQLESRGMRELVLKLLPDSFEEVIALVALYRPGPLQSGMVDNFIDRKHGRECCAYPDPAHQHPCLEPILKETYGIILYQEQAMQIAQVLAGYSLSEADLLRRVIGKKKASEMAQQRERFAAGALKQNIDCELAKKIFDLVEKFSGYAFNKSHSAAYALVTYQTLYLKAHFPAHFMAAVLSAELDHTDKLSEMLDEAKRLGLTIRGPDVNASDLEFKVSAAGHIEFGLGAIKGLGSKSVELIIQARRSGGVFKDFENFLRRVSWHEVGKAAIEKLIMAGAFDSLESNRRKLMRVLPDWIVWIDAQERAGAAGQQGLFDSVLPFSPEQPPFGDKQIGDEGDWPLKQRLQGEYQALGYYFSGDPLQSLQREFQLHGIITDFGDISGTLQRKVVKKIPILVQTIKFKRTKRGESLAVMAGLTFREKIEVVVSFVLLETAKNFCKPEALLIIEGAIKREFGTDRLRLFAQKIEAWELIRPKFVTGVNFILSSECLRDPGSALSRLKELHQSLSQQRLRGRIPAYLTTPHPSGTIVWALPEKFFQAAIGAELRDLSRQCGIIEKIELKLPSGWVLFE